MADTPPDTLPPLGEMEVAQADLPPGVDRATLRQQADALDRTVTELRSHIATMRQISPRMAATVMDEHESHVRAAAQRVGEMRGALPVTDAQLPELIGMSPDEYRVLMEEAQLASTEIAQLRTADEERIREQMPGHLDRLERVAGQMEQAAAAMRR
jgi:PHD/YefM family antitoxin component YafN of YafNO toxin-antitoxin module